MEVKNNAFKDDSFSVTVLRATRMLRYFREFRKASYYLLINSCLTSVEGTVPALITDIVEPTPLPNVAYD